MLRKFLRKRRVVQHSLLSDTVHLGKNILALAFYLNTDLVSDLFQLCANLCNDPYGVFSNYCDNGFLHAAFLLFYIVIISDILSLPATAIEKSDALNGLSPSVISSFTVS